MWKGYIRKEKLHQIKWPKDLEEKKHQMTPIFLHIEYDKISDIIKLLDNNQMVLLNVIFTNLKNVMT